MEGDDSPYQTYQSLPLLNAVVAQYRMLPEISREIYHARLSGRPNYVALNRSGQSGTERFVCISFADGTDSAVTVMYADYRRLASGAHVKRMKGDDSPYQTY